MANIAFIGLGNMGGPMAANLVKAGHKVTAFDLVAASQRGAPGVAAEIPLPDGGQCSKQVVVGRRGGIAGRLSGTLRMAINSDLVMAENRHPITQVGLLGLARKIIDAQTRNLREGLPTLCQFTEDATFEDRPCFRCVCEYVNPAHSEIYRKSEMLVDREMSLPVMVKNYGWGEKGKPVTDEDSLIEHYAYTEIEVSDSMSPTDFDPKNKKYYMRLK